MNLRRLLFYCGYAVCLGCSLFAMLAPLPLLERLYPFVLSSLFVLPAVGWLVTFVRCLYRGGE